ncbi:MAG: hypothetical protein ACI9HE_003466 [Planctomycetota bacterium]|jgi:hypothetical protein
MNDARIPLRSTARAAFQAQLEAFRRALPQLDELKYLLEARTGTCLLDWVDALHLVTEPQRRQSWIDLGWKAEDSLSSQEVLRFPKDALPPIVLVRDLEARLDLRVDDIESFLASYKDLRGRRPSCKIEGQPGSGLRRAHLAGHGIRSLAMVQRRGYAGFTVGAHTGDLDPELRAQWTHTLRARQRVYASDRHGLTALGSLLTEAREALGVPQAADLFLHLEREYWQASNRAGSVQAARQVTLGLGWGNAHKHVYRCSIEHLEASLRIFTELGFERDEQASGSSFHELVHPRSRLRVVCEADPKSTSQAGIGPFGRWTALHGESLLRSGLHRLHASQHRGRASDPAVDSERWKVDPLRLRLQVERGLISDEDAQQITQQGARGSLLLGC